jgi:hypothetical protein
MTGWPRGSAVLKLATTDELCNHVRWREGFCSCRGGGTAVVESGAIVQRRIGLVTIGNQVLFMLLSLGYFFDF